MIFKGGRRDISVSPILPLIFALFFRIFRRFSFAENVFLRKVRGAQLRLDRPKPYRKNSGRRVFRPLIIRDSTELEMKPSATTISCKRSLELLVASLHPVRRSIYTIAFPRLKDHPIAFPLEFD